MTLLDLIGIIFGALIVWAWLIFGFVWVVHRFTRHVGGLHQLQARGWDSETMTKLHNDNDL